MQNLWLLGCHMVQHKTGFSKATDMFYTLNMYMYFQMIGLNKLSLCDILLSPRATGHICCRV